MSNTDTSIATFTRILNALSNLNLPQLQSIDKVLNPDEKPQVRISPSPSEDTTVNGCIAATLSVNTTRFVLLSSVDGESTVCATGTYDECVKRLKRTTFTEVGTNVWMYKNRVVTIVPFVEQDVDITPVGEGDKPTHVVILFDNGIPSGNKSFNSEEATKRFTKDMKEGEYRIVQL